jgi:hypothetical protein
MDCELYCYKKYTLRDGIKIRRLIDCSMKRYPDITVDECLEKIKQKSYPHHHWLLILHFKHKYDKPYSIPTASREITLNEYSGKFYSRKNDFRRSGKFNEIDFILYLGTIQMLDSGFLSLEETQYHVVLDFLTLTTSMVDIETQISEYTEITIPDTIIETKAIQTDDDEDKKDLFHQMIHGKISDTTLQCYDGEINVSSLILCLHSPYFKRYFLFDSKDRKENRFDYAVNDMKNYLFYCFFKKLDKENIYPELIPMGKYLLDDSFVKYVHTEMILKIDEDETLDQKEKLDLYKNLLTYLK